MSVQAITWALALKTGSPTTKAVLLALANYANEDGESWHSQKRIADDTELSRHSVMRSMEYLADHGVLGREKRYRADGTRTTDMIILDLSCRELCSTQLRSSQQHSMSHTATLNVAESDLVCSTELQQETSVNRKRTVREPSAVFPKPEIELALEAWNFLASEKNLSKVQRLTEPRRKALIARLAECGGIEGWRVAVSKVRASPFLTGDNDRQWKANFDFFINQNKFTKLMEGAYDGPTKPPVKPSAVQNSITTQRDAIAQRLAEARAA